MKRLFIHIGHQKAGSTTIQSWFYQHQEALAAQQIHYLKAGRDKALGLGHNHSRLVGPLTAEGNSHLRQEQFKALRQEINDSSAQYFFISTEAFVNLNFSSAEIKNLRAELPQNLEIHIVLVVRRQYDWVPSRWAQGAKVGAHFKGYDEWYTQRFPDKLGNIDYDQLSHLWSDCCQPTAMHVLSFEDLIASPGGLVTALLQELELPLPADEILQDCPIENVSPTYEAVLFSQKFFALLRVCNPIVWEMLKDVKLRDYKLSRTAIADKLGEFLTQKGFGGTKQWTAFDRKQEIFEYYKNSNYDMVKRFSSLEKFQQFLAPPTANAIEIDADCIARQIDLLPEAAFFIMGELIKEIYQIAQESKFELHP